MFLFSLAFKRKRPSFQPPTKADDTVVKTWQDLDPHPHKPLVGIKRVEGVPDPELTSQQSQEYIKAKWEQQQKQEKYEDEKKAKVAAVLKQCANTKRKETILAKKAKALNMSVQEYQQKEKDKAKAKPAKKAPKKPPVRRQQPKRGYKSNPKL